MIFAIENRNLDIVRFLIQQKNINLSTIFKVIFDSYECRDVVLRFFAPNFFAFAYENMDIIKYIMSYLKLDQVCILILFQSFNWISRFFF